LPELVFGAGDEKPASARKMAKGISKKVNIEAHPLTKILFLDNAA